MPFPLSILILEAPLLASFLINLNFKIYGLFVCIKYMSIKYLRVQGEMSATNVLLRRRVAERHEAVGEGCNLAR